MKQKTHRQKLAKAGKSYEDLDPKFQRAIDMRVEGFRYQYIATVLKQKEKTVRSWFCEPDGACLVAFRQRKDELKMERDAMFDEINEQIKTIAVDAVAKLHGLVRKGSVLAVKDALDRAGFTPNQKLDLNANLPVSVNVEVVKKYANDAKQESDTKPND